MQRLPNNFRILKTPNLAVIKKTKGLNPPMSTPDSFKSRSQISTRKPLESREKFRTCNNCI